MLGFGPCFPSTCAGEMATAESRSTVSIASAVGSFGPAQALTTAPMCSYEDVEAWSRTCTQMRELLSLDAVWRRMLCDHFRPALARVAESDGSEESTDDMLVNGLSAGMAQPLYGKLCKATVKPFHLERRARLVLEIHELREWDQRQKEFLAQRQGRHVALALRRPDVAAAIQKSMSTNVLELISLMALMGNGTVPELALLPEMQFSATANQDIQAILAGRMQKRRQWWQKQREFLLQDLNWQ